MTSNNKFYSIIVGLAVLAYLATALVDNQYYFFAGFAILQLMIMALSMAPWMIFLTATWSMPLQTQRV